MDSPAVLNILRLAIAFVILMVPATAMGATLPVLVKALSRRDNNFGRVLGKLYGWNTLGATAGVLSHPHGPIPDRSSEGVWRRVPLS